MGGIAWWRWNEAESGEDGVAAYGPFVPRDVSPGDFELGAQLLFLAVRSVTPPSFESAGYATWMVRGVLP